MHMSADVVIAGGGPAGLAAGIAAAQKGFSVEIAEPCAGPIDKCCGEGLMPPALRALEQLGLDLRKLQATGSPLGGITFLAGHLVARADFAPGALDRNQTEHQIKNQTKNHVGYAVGVRRTELHALLEARAVELGVRITRAPARWQPVIPQKAMCGATFTAQQQDGWSNDESQPAATETGLFVGGERRRALWLIGADGAQSAARTALGLSAGRVSSRRFALRQHFAGAAQSGVGDQVEVHWARGAQAYLTPIRGDRFGVAILAREKLGSMQEALGQFPALARRLQGAEGVSRERGAVSSHRTLCAVTQGQAALVGDASGSVDAITGEGLSLAFLQAVALGEALQAGDLRIYQRAHTRLMRAPRLMSRVLLGMGATTTSTRLCVGLLAGIPGLFPGLLQAHTGGSYTAAMENRKREWMTWRRVPISMK
jgi:flavin-dependent dehydrogenase